MYETTRRWGRAIVWFRRDLRVADNPALAAAALRAREVIPLFVVDDRLTSVSSVRSNFLAGSLAELDAALRNRGSGLLVRSGSAATVVPEVAKELGADIVLWTRDVTSFSHRRDRAVADALEANGRKASALPGLLLVEPEALLTASGRPYSVFAPFWRALQGADRRGLVEAPSSISTPRSVLNASSMGLVGPLFGDSRGPKPGESAASERLRDWAEDRVGGYGAGRDGMAGDATSHLGADLHLGLLSPRQVEAAIIDAGATSDAYLRQLAWREFYHHLAFSTRERSAADIDHPTMAIFRSEDQDPTSVQAWRGGRTGIPTVDAAMRQLAATGWLSNRARLVVASFLTKHLLIDYRVGERHFMRHLIDGDVANNRGGWQWTAGVGADAQPFFRVFNPVRQGRRFDPDGAWVREWVPELAEVPDRYVHAPWELPSELAGELGFSLGETYPEPIVDLAEGRARALEAFRSLRA